MDVDARVSHATTIATGSRRCSNQVCHDPLVWPAAIDEEPLNEFQVLLILMYLLPLTCLHLIFIVIILNSVRYQQLTLYCPTMFPVPSNLLLGISLTSSTIGN